MTPEVMATLLAVRRAREQHRSARLAAARAARQQAAEARAQAERAFRSFSVLRRVQEAVILRGLDEGPLPPARVMGAAASLAELAQREAQLRRRAVNGWTQQRNAEEAIAAALREWSQAHRQAEACVAVHGALAGEEAARQERYAEYDLDELAAIAHARRG
jgi:hypothetical protein